MLARSKVGTDCRRWWVEEDIELQCDRDRRAEQWQFLDRLKADNLYEKEGLHDYLAWSALRGFPNFFDPLLSQAALAELGSSSHGSYGAGLSTKVFGSTPRANSVASEVTAESELPNAILHRIIGEYAALVVDKGSHSAKQKNPTLPTEVLNQIIGKYTEKVVDKGTKKEKKKHKKDKKSSKLDIEFDIPAEEPHCTVWERKVRILMSEFSMPREKAEKVMTQADGESSEAVRIVGEEVRSTMQSLANQISKSDAIQLHIKAGWSAVELRKAKQQWWAKAGVPRGHSQRMVLAGKMTQA